MVKTISQKAARESLGSPEFFEGGVYVTKNGVSELFVQTANERDAELEERVLERQVHALLKLTMMAKQDVVHERTMTPDEALKKLRSSRK
ncbi:conserved hypothetical protein [Xenorhabdus bovienii str. puntauvense]|uniref:Uncharacterized protein n=1 Tax=Xenorhabdus bovienii str. puntauvense TaxID=1398201 RepID=A0A077NEX8_XENBV|nr:hypothetical protein [Xenorhabdus bovienii]CDG96943.1 conserved hypothetical protein [Xenorhabdus bovienii str. puntauvense]